MATTKAYETVLSGLEKQILEGKLKVGSQLPGERDLATQYKVSRTAVREALRTMAAQGLIESSVGAGPKSGTYLTGQSSQALGSLLRMYVALEQFDVKEVVEARVMLERHSARLAARNAQPEDIERLRKLLAEMEEPDLPLERFNELDTHYHIEISRLANNSLITELTTAIRQSLASPIRLASLRMENYEDFKKNLFHQHREVCEAIARGDEVAVGSLIENHIRTAYSALDYVSSSAQALA